jgi:hypothetical protein
MICEHEKCYPHMTVDERDEEQMRVYLQACTSKGQQKHVVMNCYVSGPCQYIRKRELVTFEALGLFPDRS